jgi:hypothetical protein
MTTRLGVGHRVREWAFPGVLVLGTFAGREARRLEAERARDHDLLVLVRRDLYPQCLVHDAVAIRLFALCGEA